MPGRRGQTGEISGRVPVRIFEADRKDDSGNEQGEKIMKKATSIIYQVSRERENNRMAGYKFEDEICHGGRAAGDYISCSGCGSFDRKRRACRMCYILVVSDRPYTHWGKK